LYKGFTFLFLITILTGCSAHRTATLGWEGERIRIQVTPPGGSPTLECLSCNQFIPPAPLSENSDGVAYVKVDEASNAITSKFHIEAGGLDSAFTLQPPPIEEAMKKYKLSQPLTGRIMITQLAVIYEDSTMLKRVGSLTRGDEANLFSESEVFYYIHHPAYSKPVVVLRSHAFRLQ
jgi:hypothetical protein